MNGTILTNVLPSVQFLETSGGRRVAVMEADDWAGLVEWLEDIEDQQIIRAAVDRLNAGPEASGALPLESVLDEL